MVEIGHADSVFADLIDLVLPRYCLGCARPGAGVCVDCLPSRVLVRQVPGLGPVHAAASYGGGVRLAVIHYKDRRRRDLRAVLAVLLARAVAAARRDLGAAADGWAGSNGPPPVLVPVPSSDRAARERGGDHMRRLAASAAAREGLRQVALLRVGRAIEDAAGLSATARRANVAGAYVCRRLGPAAGRSPSSARASPVILVDDIVTTGASLLEAARCLQAAGYDVRGAAVVAVVARPLCPATWGEPPGHSADRWGGR